MDNRILIKTVFGRTLYHSLHEQVFIQVIKGIDDHHQSWRIQIQPFATETAQLIQEQIQDVHAFYFEPNQKWWLSHTREPDVSYDPISTTLQIAFDTIFEYAPEQM
jgi:hypothetical protein